MTTLIKLLPKASEGKPLFHSIKHKLPSLNSIFIDKENTIKLHDEIEVLSTSYDRTVSTNSLFKWKSNDILRSKAFFTLSLSLTFSRLLLH